MKPISNDDLDLINWSASPILGEDPGPITMDAETWRSVYERLRRSEAVVTLVRKVITGKAEVQDLVDALRIIDADGEV